MAKIAFGRCRDVANGFTTGCYPIVTTGTGTDHFVVIHDNHRTPGYRAGSMAGIAQVRGIDMARGLCVTGLAGANHLGMIHPVRRHRRPIGRILGMTGVAHIAGIDMCH